MDRGGGDRSRTGGWGHTSGCGRPRGGRAREGSECSIPKERRTWKAPLLKKRGCYQGDRTFGGPGRSSKQGTLVAFISGLGVNSDKRICGVTDVRSISKSIALLCLVLTFWSAIAVAVHQHSDATEAAKCTVCVAAHSASPQTPSTVVHTTFVAVATFRAEPVSAKQRLVAFALTVRPPPEV